MTADVLRLNSSPTRTPATLMTNDRTATVNAYFDAFGEPVLAPAA
jgi:hypothetical protein